MLVGGGAAWIRRRRSPTALARGELPLHIACNTFLMMTQRPTVLFRGDPLLLAASPQCGSCSRPYMRFFKVSPSRGRAGVHPRSCPDSPRVL